LSLINQVYYLHKAVYLQPKWHGEEGEWQKFAQDCIQLAPPNEGNTVYMRIVQAIWDTNDRRSFDEYGISWEIMKQGFIEADRSFPNSPWLLNNFCSAACIAGDKETARALFKRIGDHPYIAAWYYPPRVSEYKKWRDWALGDNEPGAKASTLSFPGGTEDFRQTMLLAKEGDPEAQHKLGNFYLRGEQVVQDETEAAKWFRKAAEQGHRGAEYALGSIYFNGNSPIDRDYKESTKWHYIAAIQGDSNAASTLGGMYQEGYGLKKDILKAYIWHSLVTQWKAPEVKEIAAKLTPQQLNQTELELKRMRDEIRANMEAAETRPLDPSKIKVPEMQYKKQIKTVLIPPVTLPTGNLLEGVKWQFTSGAQGNENTLSMKDGGDGEAQIKIDPLPDGCCVLVGARVRHSRQEAIIKGAPFYLVNLVNRGLNDMQIGAGLMVAPTVKEKDGNWYQVQPILSSFEAINLRFGTVEAREEEKKGSNTVLSDIKMVIFQTCDEAKIAGEDLFKQSSSGR